MIGTRTSLKTNYSRLLKNPEWFKKRKQIITRDQNQCQNCGSTINLVVHHRQYHIIKKGNNFRLPWEYNNNHLITLCSVCHTKGHKNYKVPVFNI